MTKWIAIVLAALAAGLSCYLTITSLIDSQPIGCGKGLLDCESVLSTRWSRWLGLPVSAAGMAIYTTLTGVAAMSLREVPPRLKSVLRWLLLGLIGMVVVSALWFLTLQFAVLGEFCPYCMAIHGCGLLMGVAWLVGDSLSIRELSVMLAVGLVAGVVLVAGQVTSLNQMPERDRYQIAVDPDLNLAEPIVIPWQREAVDTNTGYTRFLNGQLSIRIDSRPTLGDWQAKQVVAKLFDYTCAHCRRLHGQLEELEQRSPKQYAVVLIHVPLSPECNPYKQVAAERHAHACELSRLALAVWLENPTAFGEFDHWLCAGERSRTAELARAKAAELIGSEQLDMRLGSSQLQEMLVENVDLYAFEEIAVLPTLITEERLIGGSFSGANQLEQVLRAEP